MHVHPQGRDVTLNIDDSKTTVCIEFPLLNKDDFFIIRLLLKGEIDPDNLKFTISADELPPELPVLRLPYDMITTEEGVEESKFQFWLLFAGVVVILMGLSPIYLSFQVDLEWPFFSYEELKNIKSNISLLHISKIFMWPISVLFSLLGIAMIVG